MGSRSGNKKSSKRPWQREVSRRFKRNKRSKNGGTRKVGGHRKKRRQERKDLRLEPQRVAKPVVQGARAARGEEEGEVEGGEQEARKWSRWSEMAAYIYKR